MPSLADRIDAGIAALHISQAELARRADLPAANYISRIKSGELRARAHIQAIADVLGATVEWLTVGSGDAPAWASATLRAAEPSTVYEPMTVEPRELPVIGTVGAADGGQRGVLFEQPELKALPAHLAAVAVRGGSAYPVAYDGQWVLIDRRAKVRHNNLVVVVLMDNDEVLVKRWCEQTDGEHIALASPDGGRDSLVVHRHQVRHVWRVVGTYYD